MSEEIQNRIMSIENMFGLSGTPLRQENRKLIGEGVLTKMCRKCPKQRHFFLFSDILVYGSIVIPKKQLRNQHIIELEQVEIKELDDNSIKTFRNEKTDVIMRNQEKDINTIKRGILDTLPFFGFVVKSPKKSFAIYATSADEKEQWILHLNKCIDECQKKNGPSGMSVKSPVWIPDMMASKCMQCKLTVFSLINRRHHCRCCGIVVCSGCSTKRWHLPYQCATPVRVCDTCYGELKDGRIDKKSGHGSSVYLPYKIKNGSGDSSSGVDYSDYISETSSEDSDYDENPSINMISLTNPNMSILSD